MVLTATQLKKEFGTVTGRVEHAGERIIVRRNSRDAFALVPIDDLRLLEALENRIDILAAKESLADPRASLDWDEVEKELNSKVEGL